MRRRLRRAALALGVVAGVAVLALLALLALPPARTALLHQVLHRVDAALPGTLAIARAEWPAPGRLALEGITWTDRDTTLAALDRLAVDVDLGALAGRTLRVRRLEVLVGSLDVPRILARLPAGEAPAPEPSAEAPGGRSSGFLAEGALPGVPAIALEAVDVRVDHAVVTDTLVVEGVHLTASVELIDAARVSVEAIGGRALGPEVSILDGGFLADLGEGTFRGELVVEEGVGRTAAALRFTPIARDRFRVTLAAPDGTPPDDAGLVLEVTLVREGRRLAGIDAEIAGRTPSVEALARHPLLADALASAPALDGLAARGTAGVRFGEAAGATLDLELLPNGWLEGGRLRAQAAAARAQLDTLALRLPGVRVSARAALEEGRIDARAAVAVHSLELMAHLSPDPVALDSVWAEVDARLHGDVAAPALEARAVAAMRTGDFVLDRASVTARSEAVGSAPIDVRVGAEAMALGLDVAARVETGETVRIALAPIAIRLAGEPPPAPGALTGTVALAPGGGLEVANVGVRGALGVLSASGTREAGGRGEMRASWRADGLPRGFAVLAGLGDSLTVALDESLRAEGPFRVEATARLAPAGVVADVRLRLPGPAALAPLLPQGADVNGMGPIAGTATVGTETASGAVRVRADLAGEAWLSHAVADLALEGGRMHLDTLDVALDGVTLAASGALDPTASDLGATLALTDLALVRRFVPALPAETEARLVARVHATGASSRPALALEASGRAKTAALEVPSLRAGVSLGDDGLAARVTLPEGLTTPQLLLDEAAIAYTAPPGSSLALPGRVSVDASGPGVRFVARASIRQTLGAGDVGPATIVTTDTLEVAIDAYDARAARPFTVSLGAERIGIEALRLEGGLGSLEADGFLAPGASDLSAAADLTLPPPPAALRVPEGLWPGRVALTLGARGDSAHAVIDVTGFADDERDIALRGTAHAAASGIGVDLVLVDGDSTLVSAAGALPVGVRIFPTTLTALGDSLVADVRIEGLTVPVREGGSIFRRDPRSARLDGYARLWGTAAAPRIDAALDVGFPTWPRMAGFAAAVAVALDAGGITADLALLGGSDSLLTASARVPAEASLVPGRFALDESGDLAARLLAEGLDLSTLAPLFPGDQSIGGTCTLDLEASGAVSNPAVEGRITAERLTASLADGSRASAEMDVAVSGTARAPRATGEVRVTNGLIVVPEVPKDLHPADGRAVLWETALAPVPAAPDSSAGEATESEGGGEAATPPAITPDVDVRVVITRGFWIRGQGLEVELAGDVRVKQSGLTPTVVGELEAVRGQLELLGRRLTVERGIVAFYGDDALDPALDITLTTRIGETLIRVAVGGTATAPELTLSSEPEMTDGDIMSFLVLGRRLDELDDDQAGLLAERATDVAAQLGAAKVQAALGKRLGVDIISIQGGSGPDAEEALVVGKYLTDKILVKYEQALAEGSGFLVNLEYLLTRHLRVETLTGEERAGVEVNWTRDY